MKYFVDRTLWLLLEVIAADVKKSEYLSYELTITRIFLYSEPLDDYDDT